MTYDVLYRYRVTTDMWEDSDYFGVQRVKRSIYDYSGQQLEVGDELKDIELEYKAPSTTKDAPAPKKRGRPKGNAKPKAKPALKQLLTLTYTAF